MRARGVALVAEALAEAVDQSSALLEHLAVLASRGCNAAVLGYQSVAWMKAQAAIRGSSLVEAIDRWLSIWLRVPEFASLHPDYGCFTLCSRNHRAKVVWSISLAATASIVRTPTLILSIARTVAAP